MDIESILCVNCGLPVQDTNYKLCPFCRGKARIYAKTRRDKRRDLHLCLDCGRPIDGPYVYCDKCRNARRKAVKACKERNRDARSTSE